MKLAGVGVEYAAAVAGLGLIGWWIDQRWQTKPWGVVIGAVLGLTGATYNLIRSSMAAFEEQRLEQETEPKRSPDKGGDPDETTPQP